MILVEVSDATKANTSMQMQASDPMPCTNPLTELKAAESAAGLAPGSICGGGCPSLVDARGSRCRFNDERGTDALPRLRLVPRFASPRRSRTVLARTSQSHWPSVHGWLLGSNPGSIGWSSIGRRNHRVRSSIGCPGDPTLVPVACLDFHLHTPWKDIPDWDLCFLDCVVLTLVLADCPHLHIREKVI